VDFIRHYRDKATWIKADIDQYSAIDTGSFPPDELKVYRDNLTRMRERLKICEETITALEEKEKRS